MSGNACCPLRLGAPGSPRATCQPPQPAACDWCISNARSQRRPMRTSAALRVHHGDFHCAGRLPMAPSQVKSVCIWISPVFMFLQHIAPWGWVHMEIPVPHPIAPCMSQRPGAPAWTSADLFSVTLASSFLAWSGSEDSTGCFHRVIFTNTEYRGFHLPAFLLTNVEMSSWPRRQCSCSPTSH